MNKKPTKAEANFLVRGEYRGYPPRCEQCGWVGVATQDASPYIACYGDPTRHQRTRVGAP
jgi:hypothetical protein